MAQMRLPERVVMNGLKIQYPSVERFLLLPIAFLLELDGDLLFCLVVWPLRLAVR